MPVGQRDTATACQTTALPRDAFATAEESDAGGRSQVPRRGAIIQRNFGKPHCRLPIEKVVATSILGPLPSGFIDALGSPVGCDLATDFTRARADEVNRAL